ncbi:hypothetical protein DICA1_F37082 [Diutina catenulata]
MKLSQVVGTIAAVSIPAVSAFSDTVRVFYPEAALEGVPYIGEVSDIKDKITEFSELKCSEGTPFTVYTTSFKLESTPGSFANVLSKKYINVDSAVAGGCKVVHRTLGSEEELAEEDLSGLWVIQELYQGKSAYDSAREYLGELWDRVTPQKRDDSDSSDSSDDEVTEEQVQEEFAQAHSMLQEEGDKPVHIFKGEDPKEDFGNSTLDLGTGLFARYQFFTPGLLSVALVAGLLLYILFEGISWLASIQITYQAFEKQVDIDKKTE